MVNYEEKILTLLADKYRKSKKDRGTNVIARRTKLTPSQLYKSYTKNDGDIAQIDSLNEAIRRCGEKGFVTYDREGFISEIRCIYLVDEKIDEIEHYLEETYGYEPKSVKQRYAQRLIDTYAGRSPAANRECEKLRQVLENHKTPSRLPQIEDLLKALVFIENNQETLYLREASSLIYGDSKYLEETMLGSVCRALRDFLGRPCGEAEVEDEILEEYHIIRERQRLCLKGDVTVQIQGKTLELGAFRNGFEFFAEELENIGQIQIRTPFFTTVENYTSWLRCSGADETFFYLGGYATRHQRALLKKIYSDNPDRIYRHFGDIDAGGLYIHEHLCRVTGIPFRLHKMSRSQLEDSRFQSCLHPLTEQDRIRLRSLQKQEAYRDLAGYLLEQNVKLEQEVVSYYGDAIAYRNMQD